MEKPATYPPATHEHTFAAMTEKPDTYPSDWATLANIPALAAADHAHTAYALTTHAHAYSALTDKPSLLLTGVLTWTGDGAATRTLDLPCPFSWGDLITSTKKFGRLLNTGAFIDLAAGGINTTYFTVGAFTLTVNSVTMNTTGTVYNLAIVGLSA